ncbi:stage VI sporulation protein D [Gracilibacillus boraciitolerans JCM 21714]|uniref:Stage VI sporulation protein D n=1 Tax=Gracilibacillus boraciitolerans JCM 21714 TaxID=1298598 RepID=W4VGV7_9BACI|nr:LysM peptidoglycan-binding domain-containing protein [Gracilibacillus boraciitolerans]GAE92645.1 stage VI sporulation protein D [Gracilibacillus boraciitolerans JCM 21714]
MQEAFTFTIHEAIAFEKDQQIKEMLGIGLEPVISMEELGNTLSIRGVIELKGEYIKSDEPIETNDRITDVTYVERVESLSEEVNEFIHKFLIDVSLPIDRISAINDVSIEVDHFDYSLDTSDKMMIEATLAVHGIRDDEVQSELFEEDILPSVDDNRLDVEEESSNEVFHFKVEEEELEKATHMENNIIPIDSKREAPTNTIVHDEEAVRESRVIEDEVRAQKDSELEKPEEKLHVQAREEQLKDTSYLLNIFAEEDSSNYTRLKLYIVQPDDQMRTIAERYQVSPRQIMRTNNLDDEDVTTGQLIYIPVTAEE